MSENNKSNNVKSGKARSIVMFMLAFLLVGATAAFIYASMSGPSIPNAELDSHFDLADKNKDGNVTKEEFRAYLMARQNSSMAKKSDVRICPTTGAPCTGEGMCSSGNGEACGGGGCSSGGEGGCCSNKSMGATTVQVKSTNVTGVAEKKEGGCCGGKNKATGAATDGKKEGGCCGSKAGAEKREGGCCKSKAENEKKEVVTVETDTLKKE